MRKGLCGALLTLTCAALGSTITGTTLLQAAEILNAELAKYGKLITSAGIARATSAQ